MRAELGEHGADVVANGRLGEPEAIGNPESRQSLGEEPENLVLAGGEPSRGLLRARRIDLDLLAVLEHVEE